MNGDTREIRVRPEIPGWHIPLARASICIDCEEISFIGPTCAACASEHIMSVETWLFSMKEKS